MFRHKGKGRTYAHNLKLASILSTVAGIVNISGVLSVHTLTTNLTGHFAFFAEQLLLNHYSTAFTFLCYILFFLSGAFVSGVIIEYASKYKSHKSYIIPISLEIAIIFSISIGSIIFPASGNSNQAIIASALLFAMGLQNALVTKVSQSVVRTTHLTGLFTDLGIALSQLLFYKENGVRKALHKSIFLKIMIIGGFFLGGMLGGFGYWHFQLKILLLPVLLLLGALWYDGLLFRYYHLKRKYGDPSSNWNK
ncbi:YoaK family protein [uncultured Pedobacter sp.]|uniref:YoaK family protein n=1 Tax=uncultured Pedobacter sp. TaxID=246139 RepID=UPI0025CEE689|nr:YoaK family protein [uncultured Pedobacter sp.]